MTKYAYVDKGGILHVVKNREDAETYKNEKSKIVEVEMETYQGYPTHEGKGVWVYSPTEMKWSNKSAPMEEPIPELAELYNECMGE